MCPHQLALLQSSPSAQTVQTMRRAYLLPVASRSSYWFLAQYNVWGLGIDAKATDTGGLCAPCKSCPPCGCSWGA